jgi:ubiquinone/menaquinone biosynthesis C-methylase UbiE
VNYFLHNDTAERYGRSRPYFHPQVVRRIAQYLRLREPVRVSLDVACGTGLSSVALTEIAARVVGTDSSAAMLAQAPRNVHFEYVEASAENLPFPDGSFDLVTAASAFHWFDRYRFLSEASRVLSVFGWLVVYDNFFFNEMRENAEYGRWHRDLYLSRYPVPPRDGRPLAEDEVESYGFSFARWEEYANDVRFSVEELAAYLETQSNVIAAAEEGAENLEEVHRWLVDSVAPFFPGPVATFEFGGHIWYLKTTQGKASEVSPEPRMAERERP